MNWLKLDEALQDAIKEEVCTAASMLVSRKGEILYHSAFGRNSDRSDSAKVTVDSVFDLASLTKPLATTLACLGLAELGFLNLNQTLTKWFDLPEEKKEITPKHLLCHTSGLPAWRPYYKEIEDMSFSGIRRKLLELLLNEPLVYKPGTKTVYSDLGFMLLQLIVEEISQVSLAEYVIMNYCQPLGIHDLGFVILPDGPGPARERFVATEYCPWRKRLIQGEVNDENAWAMGGIAGQAGLFGTAKSAFYLMEWLAASVEKSAIPRMLSSEIAGLIYEKSFEGQPRPIGFDVPTGENPSTGKLASDDMIGHLGFVGTSLWRRRSDGLMVVLLTNRTIFGRDNDKITAFRPYIHDIVSECYEDFL